MTGVRYAVRLIPRDGIGPDVAEATVGAVEASGCRRHGVNIRICQRSYWMLIMTQSNRRKL